MLIFLNNILLVLKKEKWVNSPLFLLLKMNAKTIEKKAYDLLEDYLESMGYEVVLIEFLRDGKRWVLRIYIDKENGITIDNCAEVSDLISPLLDVEDFIAPSYSLEVSSPGVNRPLRKKEHFEKVVGETVKISLTEPLENNRKNLKGKLIHVKDTYVAVEIDKEVIEVPMTNIKKSKLIYNF